MKGLQTTLLAIFAGVVIAIFLSNIRSCRRHAAHRYHDTLFKEEVVADTLASEPTVGDSADIPVQDTIIYVGDLQGNTGKLRVALRWDFPGDIDLHVVQPNGRCIDYRRTKDIDGGGRKDVDNLKGGNGAAENIYWEVPSMGDYKVFLHYYPHPEASGRNGKGNCTIVVEWQKPDGTFGRRQYSAEMFEWNQWRAMVGIRVSRDDVIFFNLHQGKPSADECKARK